MSFIPLFPTLFSKFSLFFLSLARPATVVALSTAATRLKRPNILVLLSTRYVLLWYRTILPAQYKGSQ